MFVGSIKLHKKKNLRVWLICLGVFLLSLCYAFNYFVSSDKAYAAGNTYYVDNLLPGSCVGGVGTSYSIINRDCSGSDGTKAYKTFGVALTGSRVARGDTIYGRSGTYAETDISMAIAAGTGPVTITPYNNETVIIDPGTLTNYMWRNPTSGYDIVVDGGANRTLSFQNSGSTTKAFFYLSGGNTTITRTIISDPSIRTAGWVTENTAVGSLTFSRNLIHDMGGLLIAAQNSTASFVFNLISNKFDNINGIISIYQQGATLNEYNNTIARGSGTLHVMAQDVSVNSANNIFVLKTNGLNNKLFQMLTIPLSSWNFKNNIVWRESITDYNDYSKIITSGTYLYNIDKSNRFVDPVFTNYGTSYADADLTLQNIQTNYASGNGLNSSLPIGGDFTGAEWLSGDNSVGCYINPTVSPNQYPTITDKVAFAGDSIMSGSGAPNITSSAWSRFSQITGMNTVNNKFGDAAGDISAISGQSIEGAQWLIDRTIFEGAPNTVFVSIGINNLMGNSPSLATNAERASGVGVIFDKLIDANIKPIWLGAESKIGNPPDNTDPINFNNEVSRICNSRNIPNGSILNQMLKNDNWKTDYYDDLTTNVHPNGSGHDLIAKLAEYLYFSKGTMGIDGIDISGGARIFKDGSFRNLNSASGNIARLSVAPQSGSFAVDDYSYWMDIDIISWSVNGDYDRSWTESSSVSDLSNTAHTVGDLAPSKHYNVSVDNMVGNNIIGDDCLSGICLSDENGRITFVYTGGYSAHTFEVKGEPIATTAPLDHEINPSDSITATPSASPSTLSILPETGFMSDANKRNTVSVLLLSLIISFSILIVSSDREKGSRKNKKI